MSKSRVAISALLLVLLLLVACASAAAPAPAVPAAAPSASGAAPKAAPEASSRPAWQVEWERVLGEGKRERKVILGTALGSEPKDAIVRGLSKAYGINVEAVAARATEINTKVIAERRAGLYLWDILVGGTTSPYTDLEPAGALAPLDTALILPDVTDPELIKKTWYRGELWWVDPNHLLLATLMFPHPPLAVNTTMVNPAEIKSYNYFLDPKWKGKMTINDPTQPGTTIQSFILTTFGPDWMRNLVKQEPIIMRDQRQQVDWLAQSKNPIALGIKVEEYTYFKSIGAPIQQVVPAEGTWLSTGSSAVMMVSKQPHPNTTKVFINWYLSKEAQTMMSKVNGGQSSREDVPTDFLTSDQIRQPGVKYWEKERKDLNLKKAEDIKLTKELFAPLVK